MKKQRAKSMSMKHLPTVSPVSTVNRSRRRHRYSKTQQGSNVTHSSESQTHTPKLFYASSVVKKTTSVLSAPCLSVGTARQRSFNVSVIHISQSEIQSTASNKQHIGSQNNSLQKSIAKSANHDKRNSVIPPSTSRYISSHSMTILSRVHSNQRVMSATNLDSIHSRLHTTGKTDHAFDFHSKRNAAYTTSVGSLFDPNSRQPDHIYSYKEEENEKRRRRRRRRGGYWTFCCPCCSSCCCLLTGILLALFLAGLAALIGILITIKTKSTTTTTTTTTSSSTSTTTTSVTTTTSTSSTSSSSSSTSSSTSTSSSSSSTTSTSTSSSSTSSTSTSSTSSSSTSSTSTSSTSSSSTSATSSTSTSSTSVTSTTATSTTSTSTSTTSIKTTTVTTATTTTTAATVTITSNTCTSGWKGVTVLYHCDNCPDIAPYTQYTYTYTAIANQTRIAFAFREDAGCFALDTVSVRSTTAPTVELILNNDFETGTISSWTYCNPLSASAAGAVMKNSDNFQCMGYTFQAKTGTHFYYDGAVGNCDYLIQTFATTIGSTYTISFWLYNRGVSSASSADVIISI